MYFPKIEPLEARIAPATFTLVAPAPVTEGNSGTKTVTFTGQLSAALAADAVITFATQDGTAVAGSDYVAKQQAVTIPAGSKTASFTVTINGDTTFESTESFFVNVTGLPAGVTVVNSPPLSPLEQATARAYIYNDDPNQLASNKVQWVDVDGDLVTLTSSKASLPLSNSNIANPNLSRPLFTFTPANSLGGMTLQKLDLQAFGTAFAGANITITATKQPGFPGASDGRVNVGFINATFFNADELQAFGIDLGTVKVDGDLAKITAGDSFSTAAIAKLDVYSLGVSGATTLPNGDTSVESKVLGPIGTVLVKNNLEGYLHVVGSVFGNIGTLKIGGDLKGGSADNTGRVQVSGRLSSATIGAITGGSGDSTGLVTALLGSTGSLGNITVLGDIVGGTGNFSGAIAAPRIGNVTAGSLTGAVGGTKAQSGIVYSQTSIGKVMLTGDLIGGGGDDSGAIFSGTNIASVTVKGMVAGGAGAGSGSIRAAVDNTGAATGFVGSIGSITIGENTAHDSLKGGAGVNSGRIDVAGKIASFTTAGNVRGSSANGTGGIVAGGDIAKVVIGKSLIGGDSTAAAFLNMSGFISAQRLKSVAILGDIVSGVNGGGGIASSGSIRSNSIDTLTVQNVTGNNTATNQFSPVVISAIGVGSKPAIKNITVLGDVKVAEILAGYDSVTTAGNFRGTPKNGDASIGSVLIGGSVLGTNIVAGGQVGADTRFGSADDTVIPAGTGVINDPGIVSQIASVIIKGAILANPAGAAAGYGIVAQLIGSIKLGAAGTPVPLHAGPGNDRPPTNPLLELGTATNFHAVELL